MHYLDFIGAVLGIIYILLEYRASIWLWAVSIIMPLVDMMLYFRAGLYADFGMAIYYALAAIYGYAMWRWKKNGKAVRYTPKFTRARGSERIYGSFMERPRYSLRKTMAVSPISGS